MSESKPTLDQQVKAAERDKYLAEANKAEAERRKIDFERNEAENQLSKSWWKRPSSWKYFASVIPIIVFLSFFIPFVVIPGAEIKSIDATLQNKKIESKLVEREQQLHLDSERFKKKEAQFRIQVRYVDSVNAIVNIQNGQINLLKNSRHKVDSTYAAIIKLYTKKQNLNDSKIQEEFQKLKKYLDDYKNKKDNYVGLANNPLLGYTPSGSPYNYTTLPTSFPVSSENIISSNFKTVETDLLSTYNNITFRPLYKGETIKNLTIVVTRESNPLSIIDYNTHLEPGNYIVSIANDGYNISSVRSSSSNPFGFGNSRKTFMGLMGGLPTEDNSFTVVRYEKVLVDIILEKK